MPQAVIKQAEARLNEYSRQQGFAMAALKVIFEPKCSSQRKTVSPAAPKITAKVLMRAIQVMFDKLRTLEATQVVSLDSPVEIRQAAAVNFKNFVKFNWV